MSAKPAPMVCVTDDELFEALRASKVLRESGADSPEFVESLKCALKTQAARKARQEKIALLWAQPLGVNEWEKVQ
jgi:hypothetical protein